MLNPKIIGDKNALITQSGYPRYYYDSNGTKLTLCVRGSLYLCQKMKKTVGDYINNLVVRSVDIRTLEVSGLAEMITIADNYSSSDAIVSDDEYPIIEVEWAQLTKSIESHSHFASLTKDELKAVDDAINGDGSSDDLSSLALSLYEKKQKGVESYFVPAPVVRRTSLSSAKPTTTACGTISSPPLSIDGYEFIKSADRATRRGKGYWERTEEWMGATEWDSDLYS